MPEPSASSRLAVILVGAALLVSLAGGGGGCAGSPERSRGSPGPDRPPRSADPSLEIPALTVAPGATAEDGLRAPEDASDGVPSDAPPAARGPEVLRARRASWRDVLDAGLDPDRLVPRRRAAELQDGAPPVLDLTAALRTLVRRRFPGSGDRGDRTLGDLIAPFARHVRDSSAARALLEESLRRDAAVDAATVDLLEPLLVAGWTHDARWTPERTESAAGADDDGILEGPSFTIGPGFSIRTAGTGATDGAREAHAEAAWRGRRLHQAATIVFATPAQVRAADLDHRRRREHRGVRVIAAYPVAGSALRGSVGSARPAPFLAWRAFFVQRLGFPWGDLAWVAQNVERVEDDGVLTVENHAEPLPFSGCRSFDWQAGRDTILPVVDGSGVVVATIIVSVFGFDIAGLWEQDGHRREAARTRLGHLAREATRLAASRDRSRDR